MDGIDSIEMSKYDSEPIIVDNKKVVVGIDLGLYKTGICIIKGNPQDKIIENHLIAQSKNNPINTNKLVLMIDKILDVLPGKIDCIFCEYPFAVRGHGRILIELLGSLKYLSLKKNIPFVTIPQTTLKKHATGKGNASKSDMVLKAYIDFNLTLTEDEADALWLADIGIAILFGICKI